MTITANKDAFNLKVIYDALYKNSSAPFTTYNPFEFGMEFTPAGIEKGTGKGSWYDYADRYYGGSNSDALHNKHRYFLYAHFAGCKEITDYCDSDSREANISNLMNSKKQRDKILAEKFVRAVNSKSYTFSNIIEANTFIVKMYCGKITKKLNTWSDSSEKLFEILRGFLNDATSMLGEDNPLIKYLQNIVVSLNSEDLYVHVKDKHDEAPEHAKLLGELLSYLLLIAFLQKDFTNEVLDSLPALTAENDNLHFLISKKPVSTMVAEAGYYDLIKAGYTPLTIAEALVRNDMHLYANELIEKPIKPENEGTAKQWAQYLSSVPESFQYIVNSKMEIIGNFSFVSIDANQLEDYLNFRLVEKDFSPATTKDLFSASDDHILFLLNLSVNDEYSTVRNNTLLRKMFLNQLIIYAENGVRFKKIIVNVFKPSHEAFYKEWGFRFLKANQHSGNIYELDLMPYPTELYECLKATHDYKLLNRKLKLLYDDID